MLNVFIIVNFKNSYNKKAKLAIKYNRRCIINALCLCCRLLFTCCLSTMEVSPIKIGTKVEHQGRLFKIVNHEKPNPNFARHYIIQAFDDGERKK